MATKAEVLSETRPAWSGYMEKPVVSMNMTIRVQSDRSAESLAKRVERIKQFVKFDEVYSDEQSPFEPTEEEIAEAGGDVGKAIARLHGNP